MRTREVLAAIALAAGLCAAAPAHAAEKDTGGGGKGLDPKPSIGAQAGFGGWTGGRGDATWLGPAWGVQAGVNTKWVGLFANYSGQYNDARDARAGDGVGITNSTVYGSVRLSVPLGPVQPFVSAGLGGSWVTLRNANDVATPLESDFTPAAPLAGGVSFQLSQQWSIGAQGSYQLGLASTGGSSNLNVGNNWSTGLTLSAQP